MPAQNRFRHQTYPAVPRLAPVLKTVGHGDGDSTDFAGLTGRLSIRKVLLVHGTFTGHDPLGIAEAFRRIADSVPLLRDRLHGLAATIEEHTHPLTEKMMKDVANYCPEYRDRFQELTGTDVSLLEPTWSSQNNALARADLAVRLLCELNDMSLDANERVLLWGHSHAGQGFAILTNLLANDREMVEEFFDAVRHPPGPCWQQARAILANAESPHPLAKHLNLVAFGTPVRYGWDTDGCNRLIHVLHHRACDPDNPQRAKPLFPPHNVSDFLTAAYGDWVQAFAIAGTDFAHLPAPGDHQRLRAILEAGLAEPDHGLDTRLIFPRLVRNTCARWKTGSRCHADGQHLLLEYRHCGRRNRIKRPIEESVFGHGVATTLDWLPTHLALILDTLNRNVDE